MNNKQDIQISKKIQHKHWIQSEIIQLELEGAPSKYVEAYKNDLVRIENELFELAKE